MAFNTILSRVPTGKLNQGIAKNSGNRLVRVNNRQLVGGVGANFGQNRQTNREKLQLRHLMTKTKSEDYSNNPIAQRRLNQQIAGKIEHSYGISAKKMMGAACTLRAVNSTMTQSNLSLRDKVNGK